MAKIAAAATITHLAQVAGQKNTAKTTTAIDRMNRQKQSFMISPPHVFRRTDLTMGLDSMASSGVYPRVGPGDVELTMKSLPRR